MAALRRSTAFAYFIACSSTVAVAAFRWSIGDFARDQITLLPFLLSVTIAARYGGLGPGLLATVLGALASVALFVHPTASSFLGDATDQIRLCVFLFIGTVISYLYAALISASARAEANALDAIDKQRKLEEADRNKNDFLATLAHEMRNPLAVIQGELAAVQVAELPPSFRSCFDLLQRQGFVLTRLTADLFDLSTISRGKLRLRMAVIDLRDVVRSAIDAVRPALENHHHTLNLELPEQPLFVTADATRLTQVFVNLLTNSIKYTNDGGFIRITASIDERQIVVRVIDNGIGISGEHLPRLFDLGEQVEKDIERSDGGLGIGLAVVRRLVEMHGGLVDAASGGAGHGCKFTVRLPIAKQTTEGESAVDLNNNSQHDQSTRDASRLGLFNAPRILVVDDHGSIAKACAAILRDHGYEAQFATNGKSAVQIAHEFNPDIALIDINMPQMNGYELAHRIKETQQGNRIMLVAMTGAAGEREVEGCTEAGYECRLEKPLDIEDLRRVASHWIERTKCKVASPPLVN